MGVSHFLEHMMFLRGREDLTAEGTQPAVRRDRGPQQRVHQQRDDLLPRPRGSRITWARGWTSWGRMMRPALKPTDFDTEKGVILEEIAMYKDSPFWVLYEACVEKHFGAHPSRTASWARPSRSLALRRDQMKAYFDSRYSADNTLVALAGPWDFDSVCRQIETLSAAIGGPTRVGRGQHQAAPGRGNL